MSTSRYYRPSGRFGVGGVIQMLVFGGIGAVLIGAVYAYIVLYNPFIYINFLATLGFGLGVGIAVGLGCNLGKVRNPALGLLIGVIVGVAAVYAHWVVWIHAAAARADADIWILDPLGVLGALVVLAEQGVWSIRSWTPTGGTLYAIWGLEGLMIAGMATILSHKAAAEPFCETCNEWTEETIKGAVLGFAADADGTKRALESGDLEALDRLEFDPAHFSQCTVKQCKTTGHPGYLTLTNIEVKTDDKGKQEKDETTVVEELILPGETEVEKVRSILANMGERIAAAGVATAAGEE